jgi:hypothetical protein
MSLRKDEYGFLRSTGFGHARGPDLRAQLNAAPDDQLYQSSSRGGVRTSKPVYQDNVSYQPGDTFAVGPKVTKAGLPAELHEEWRALQRGGYANIKAPEETDWGFAIKLKNFLLPGGIRTNALVLLPRDYPITPPLGFYIHEDGLDEAKSVGIDLTHLFPDKTFYGAPNFSEWGWAWFCLKFQPWRPGHHTLIGIIMMVAAVIAEGART